MKKTVLIILSFLLFLIPGLHPIVVASEIGTKPAVDELGLVAARPSREQLVVFGLSKKEIDVLFQSDDPDVVLGDGDVEGLEKVGVSSFGKTKITIKALLKAYNNAPKPVKRAIDGFVGIVPLLGLINHFTGAVEDGIYWACVSVGMPNWLAWTVAKTLTLFL